MATRAIIAERPLTGGKEMADGNQNQNNDSNQNRTFTQAEVDSIVGERLARERAKYPDYEELKNKAAEYDKQQDENKSELQKAQDQAKKLQEELNGFKKQEKIRTVREQVSKDTGVPVELLSGEDEESCKAQAQAALKFAKGNKYPGIREGRHEGGRGRSTSSDPTEEDYREMAGQLFGRKD